MMADKNRGTGSSETMEQIPLMNGRLHHAVAQRLATQVVNGSYPAGHVFPAEVEHAELLGVSRSVLREAFRMLTAKGMVSSRPKAGTRVNERRQWNLLDPDVLSWQIQCGASDDFLRDLFELRMVVEPQAAEMAALRRDQRQLLDMGNALEAMERYTLTNPKGRAADIRFHELLMEATRNEMLQALSNSISTAIASTTTIKHAKKDSPRDPMPEHYALYAQIAEQNPAKARKAMITLIELAHADTQVALRR
jgi:DNA-binding FadR family transcriptional regulator